jgi:hypothetical protein
VACLTHKRSQAAQVIAFPPLAARSARPAPPDDTERGRILLFTGVQYERPRAATSETGDESSAATGGRDLVLTARLPRT